ncbi:hypothetical protein, partial [Candidatus Burkholderia verschuerenii]|uniref:hypothetical protein n=1 Tax=Candidatus Burkholderia verschuerenii TaxID=242163 RepID=UPI001E3C62E7
AQRHASTSTRALQTWLRCAFTSAPDCVVGSIPANSILQARLFSGANVCIHDFRRYAPNIAALRHKRWSGGVFADSSLP